MTKKFVAVAGNIGVGKTSLTERIGKRLGWQTAYESVVNNPYLAEFYADMRSWSFHLQVYFLGQRAQQHKEMALSSTSAISDRSIFEDAEIFARALQQMGNINDRDYESYRAVYDVVVDGLPQPDLLLHLSAPVEILMDRIQHRARGMESGITKEYLSLLDGYYEDWLTDFDLCPVLTIRCGHLDFVHKPEHLDIVIGKMENRLSGRDEVILP